MEELEIGKEEAYIEELLDDIAMELEVNEIIEQYVEGIE